MNPFLWLLWGLCAIVLLFIGSAAYAVAREGLHKPHDACPRCGYVDGDFIPDRVPPEWSGYRDGDIDEGPPR